MGRKAKDLKNEKIGKLVVIKQIKAKNKSARWLCKCECGKYTEADSNHLQKGSIKSCGCEQGPKKKHQMCNTRIYKIWEGMKERCYTNNEKTQNYKNYKSRDIKVCDEWKEFINFYTWAIANGYEDNLTIDRIDNNGNYEPNNCRWVDMKTQCNNRRSNIIIKYNNEEHTLMEWSEILNIKYHKLHKRLKYYKWSIEKAFNIK